MADIQVNSVQFSNDAIEVSYSESRDLHESSGILEIRTRLIPSHLVEEQLRELIQAIQDVVDESNVIQRKPPQTIQHP